MIPVSILRTVAWIIFILSVAMGGVATYLNFQGNLEPGLALAFVAIAIVAFPNFKGAGWGVFRGRNLCKNRPTYIVALVIYGIFATAFWEGILDDLHFDPAFALGTSITGLLLVRAYSAKGDSGV